MKPEKLVLFLVMAAVVLFCSAGYAEVVYLTDGRVVRGEIINETDQYIVVEESGFPRRYYNTQVERVEADDMDTSGIDFEQYESMGMPARKARLIVRLMSVSGVRQNMQQSIDQTMARVPADQKYKYENMFVIEEIMEKLIPIYDKYYSENDLQQIIAFYESPSGQKLLEVTPEIVKESIDVLLEYVREKGAL